MRTEYFVQDGQVNPLFVPGRYGTQWKITNRLDIALQAQAIETIDYPMLVGKQGARLVFQIPDNTTLMVINGTSGPDYGGATFSFEPKTAYEDLGTVMRTTTDELAIPTTVSTMVLDPTVRYNVTITGLSHAGNTTKGGIGLHSAEFYSSIL